MKKLIALAVLLVSLTAAVFAQEENKDGKWKVGFMARYVTDMFYVTAAKAKSESKTTYTSTPTPPPDNEESTVEFGKYNKGSIGFFSNQTLLPHPDNRLLVSISNSGENYDVYADIALDDWANAFAGGYGVLYFLLNTTADWWLKGKAGIFDAQVGTASYEGFVSTQGAWNDWLNGPDYYELSKFGVWKYTGDSPKEGEKGFLVSDNFRTWNEWGSIFAMGATFADNFRLSVGYKLNPAADDNIIAFTDRDAWASKSSINGSFMFSGRVPDMIDFDLFYSIIGKDEDTFARPVYAAPTTVPPAYWSNIIGAYVGLNFLKNLGLSLGYTASFDAYEKAGYYDYGVTDITNSKPRTFKAPFYSGIDLHASFTGIDKIGLTFNNNLSFAGVKAAEVKYDSKEVVLGFNSAPYTLRSSTPLLNIDESKKQDWFHWQSELQATLGFVENLGLTLILGNQLGVFTDTQDYKWTGIGIASGTTTKNSSKSTMTTNDFRVGVTAEYAIGAVTVGTGLFFGLNSTNYKLESETNTSGSGYSSSSKTTEKTTTDVTTFGIPLFFKVAF